MSEQTFNITLAGLGFGAEFISCNRANASA